MKCPVCGGDLLKVSVLGFDDSYRCQNCGGVWAANWVVNNLAVGKEIKLKRENKGVQPIQGDHTNKCPLDGTMLAAPGGEVLPISVAAQRCNMCGGWWFGGDELFKFQEAFKIKGEFVKTWKKSDWMTYAWPALVLMLMVAGVGGGVVLVKQQQRAATQASFGIRDLVVLNLGGGEVEIMFKASVPVHTIEFRDSEMREWNTVMVEQIDGTFKVDLKGLIIGNEYFMRVGAKEYKFTVR